MKSRFCLICGSDFSSANLRGARRSENSCVRSNYETIGNPVVVRSLPPLSMTVPQSRPIAQECRGPRCRRPTSASPTRQLARVLVPLRSPRPRSQWKMPRRGSNRCWPRSRIRMSATAPGDSMMHARERGFAGLIVPTGTSCRRRTAKTRDFPRANVGPVNGVVAKCCGRVAPPEPLTSPVGRRRSAAPKDRTIPQKANE